MNLVINFAFGKIPARSWCICVNCLRGCTVTMSSCHAEIPGSILGPGEGFVWSPFISLVMLGVIYSCLCVFPWYSRF